MPFWRHLRSFALLLVLAFSLGSLLPGRLPPSRPPAAVAADNSVVAENRLPGTASWRITNPAVDGEIQAYTGATSYDRGAKVDLHVSTRRPGTPYRVELYRLGWYKGLGARQLTHIDGLKGDAQGYWTPKDGLVGCSSCRSDPATGLLEADWSTSYLLPLDRSWPSGAYLARLTDANGKQTYATFVVRDDARDGGLLVQLSVATWQAYNGWGDRSLYGGFGSDRRWQDKNSRAYKVSFARPYAPLENDQPGYGAGELFRFEYDFIRWAESEGFDVTYDTDVDTSARPDILTRKRGFVSVGHDEYWSRSQRQGVALARDAGVGLAFLGGNDVYWQVRYEPAMNGAPNSTLVCYKDAALDPLAAANPSSTTVLWADPPVNWPQSWLTGTAYGSNATPEQQSWVVADETSWPLRGTGLRAGTEVAGLVGYEYDHQAPPDETPAGLQNVGLSPVNGWLGMDESASVEYVAGSGAPVFNAGTIQWAWGLDDFGHETVGRFANPLIQSVSRNVLNALLSLRGAALQAPAGQASAPSPGTSAAP